MSNAQLSVTVHTWGERISRRGRRRGTQRSQALLKRVQSTRSPGLEQARRCHAGFRPRCTPAAPTDRADDHQRANTTLRLIIISAQPRHQHKRKQFVFVAQQPRVLPRGTHLLAAYLPHQGVVLAQVEVDQKENEIVAAPCLLADLDLTGTVVTGDAMHRQWEISRQMVDQGASISGR